MHKQNNTNYRIIGTHCEQVLYGGKTVKSEKHQKQL